MSEVCKICFNSSSHKANPTLTPEAKAVMDPTTKKKTCPACKQSWNGLQVSRDPELNKWVAIRPRPKILPHIDYQLCASVQRKASCQKGQGLCTFAHSKVELLAWNKERWKEARPRPPAPSGAHQYQLCKHVLTEGNCPYGQRCTFAHSEEELRIWVYGSLEKSAALLPTPSPVQQPISEFSCRACDIYCTSQRQLEEHQSGARHHQAVAATSRNLAYRPMPLPRMPVPPPPAAAPAMSGLIVRPRPNRFPMHGYRICSSVASGRRCFYGDACSFAHSQMELDTWNQDLQTLRQVNYSQINVVSPPSQPVSSPPMHFPAVRTEGQLDEFIAPAAALVSAAAAASGRGDYGGGAENKSGDFAQRIRQQLILIQQDSTTLNGLEKMKDHVSICEITGTSEAITVNKIEDTIFWVYEISTSMPRQLLSVVLFDILAPEFSIEDISLVTYGGHARKIQPTTKAQNGSGFQFDHVMLNPPDKVHVKVAFRPRYGLLGQVVLFNFSTFQMVRCLSAHVVNEQEELLLRYQSYSVKPARKTDLFLEQRFTTMDWSGNEFTEMADRHLGDYMLPEQVEKLIDSGKYKNVEQKITKENYVRRMHNLMYVEEYQQRKDLSRYDLYDIEVSPQERIQIGDWLTQDPHYLFIRVTLDEVLFEGGRSIRMGDLALLWPINQKVLHECYVEAVGRESVVLKITPTARDACQASRNRCSLRFILSRVQMRAMHQAVDSLDVEVLFPDSSATRTRALGSSTVERCFRELEKSELTLNQQLAIRSMLDPALKQIPTLVLGPFGCGKTRALLECVKLLGLHATTESKILVCTHSNSAADLYVEAIHKEWQARSMGLAPMFRLYYSGRNLQTVSDNVKRYCRIVKGKFEDYLPSELSPYSIIVSTLVNARKLWLVGMKKGYFTHILIDEAAQALESEAAIALCLADSNTKIVLAGDHMQMDPPVYSSIARKYGLHISLLERLYESDVYLSAPSKNCKVLLTENHRSHQQILELPSKLFYNSKLSCKAVLPQTGPKHIPPVQFVGVDGHEQQDEDSPSFYNDQEVFEVANTVEKFQQHQNGLDQADICVLAYFRKQVQRIRTHLRKRKFPQVKVFRVDDVQGKEYRALIISTVRTCASDAKRVDEIEMEDGFFTNAKLFNTAITRAREWLVIVGEPITLCTVGYNSTCWLELIQKCLELKTFHYPMSQLFMHFLEGRLITRRIMEKQHGDFFKKSFSTTGVHENRVSSSGGAYEQREEAMSAAPLPQRTHSVTPPVPDRTIPVANPVVTMEHAGHHNAQFLPHASAASFPTPMAQPNIANLMGDLPPFLTQQLDALTRYLKWCDSINVDHYPHILQQNLLQQKSLLQTQMKIANDQILKYREFMKLVQYAQGSSASKAYITPNPLASYSHPESLQRQGQMLPLPSAQLLNPNPLTQSFSQTTGSVDLRLPGSNIRQGNALGMHMMAAGIPGQMAHYGGMSLPMGVEAGHERSNLPQADPRHVAKQHNTLTQTMDKDFTVLSYRDLPHGHKQDLRSLTSQQPSNQDHGITSNPNPQTTQLISPLSNLPSSATAVSQLRSGAITSSRIPTHAYGSQDDLYVSDDDI